MFATEQDIISAALGLSPRSRAVIIESLFVSLDDTERREYINFNKLNMQDWFKTTKSYKLNIHKKPFSRIEEEARANVAELQKELLEKCKEDIPSDEPFLGNLTFDEYCDLSDDEQGKLWDKYMGADLMSMEEQELNADMLLTR